jgi:signal transduction histidine kinase
MPHPGGEQGGEHRLLRQIDAMERQLQDLSRAMEHRERLATLGTVAGLLAHEFNNILTPIMSYAQMALAAPQDADLTAKALKRAAEGSERASQIAGVILGFIKQDGPSVTDVPRGTECLTANVPRCVEQALCCMVREPEKDGIKLLVTIPQGIEAAMRPVSLQHVLLNLILNARAAMSPGGGHLEITAEVMPMLPKVPKGAITSTECSTWNISGSGRIPTTIERKDGGWVVITVKDTGRGMSTAKLGCVFATFGYDAKKHDDSAVQPKASHQPYVYQPAGTGLGLTLCRQLLEEVGGRLVIWSEEKKGTVCQAIVRQTVTESEGLRCSA